MKYKRARIERALRLLKYTNHPAWSDIVIDTTRLSQWQINGDLANSAHNLAVTEPVEHETDVMMDINPTENTINSSISAVDGSDLGPAPLQFVGNPSDECHSSIIHPNDQGNSRVAELDLLQAAVEAARKRLTDNGTTSNGIQEEDEDSSQTTVNGCSGDTKMMKTDEVFERGGFVNMDTNPWA